ncbi:phage tail protein [Streptomyces canus]|uniref:phage tail protein n=1 Tax=Streptomyces canus TaxID=58343 RepID=UPI00367DE889
MTCATERPLYRLLSGLAGWEPVPGQDLAALAGLTDPEGLQLAPLGGDGDGLSLHPLRPWFPPPRLAPGCGPCDWYLLADPPDGRSGLRVLRRSVCADGTAWQPLWPASCSPDGTDGSTAIAARGHVLAVADPDGIRVWRSGLPIAHVTPGTADAFAVCPDGGLVTAVEGELKWYDPSGLFLRATSTGVNGPVLGVRHGRNRTVWLLTGTEPRPVRLWRAVLGPDGRTSAFAPAELDDLAAEADPSTLTIVSEAGFCLREHDATGSEAGRCFGWDGLPAQVEVRPPPRYTEARLLAGPVDSGVPRCRWHRVRVRADVPPGCSVTVTVATVDAPDDPPPLSPDRHAAPASATDFLIDQPPGRFLYIWLTLTGDGTGTPVVHHARLDFPRTTSADLLPAVYRQDPLADDFTERFLSLFDSVLEDMDRAVERHPALLDPTGTPDSVLPWLGNLLGLRFPPALTPATRRALLHEAAGLYRLRGTPEALRRTMLVLFGITPVVQELAADRTWATLGTTRLEAAVLFGRTEAALRLGSSALGHAPLSAPGDPGSDPATLHAHRVRLLLPPTADASVPDIRTVRTVAAAQAPAHTVVEVVQGSGGLVVGRAAVGVDTLLVGPPAPVLGRSAPPGRAVRLGRDSVLWPCPGGFWAGMALDAPVPVGVGTVAR